MAAEGSKEKLLQVSTLLDSVIEDTGVPKNLRKTFEDTKQRLLQASDEPTVMLANAIYKLEEVSNDINIPFHVRTAIWGIISEMERLKEELK